MSTRRILVFFALPLIVFLERLAYFGARAVLPLHMRGAPPDGLGMGAETLGYLFAAQGLFMTITPLFGGAMALGTGPIVPLVVGGFVASVGYALLGAGGPSGLYPAFALIALGSGLVRPSVLAIAATEIGDGRENARNALFYVVYVATNLGALLAPSVGTFMGSLLGYAGWFGVAAGVSLLASILAGGFFAALRFMAPPEDKDPRAPATPPSSPGVGRAVIAVAVLLIAVSPSTIANAVEWTVRYSMAGGATSAVTMSAVHAVNPVVTIAVSVAGAVTMLVLAVATRWTAPTIILIGAGLVLAGIGSGGLSALAWLGAPMPLVILVSAVSGVGEGIFYPLALARVSSATSPRLSPLLIAGFLTATSALSFVATSLSSLGGGAFGRILLGAAALACVAAGALLAVFSRTVERMRAAP